MLRCYTNYKILCELVNIPETIVISIITQLKKELITYFRSLKLEWEREGAKGRNTDSKVENSDC